MGKKAKTGKNRLDKYYHLAKEQGYRARSAFKLIQILRKLNVFENCTCLLDLCAAPGGWLQVARKYLPDDATIIGIDLDAIKAIRNVITIQCDIKSQQCKNVLQNILKDNLCDVVLHDGSPNMGTDWNLHAYNQNELVISALKLATSFLKRKGTFLTKVFRSQHYTSVFWVLQQLFEKIHVIKPPASRTVSAELFLVCTNYKAPQKIDPKFFCPQSIFACSDYTEKPVVKKRGLKELLNESSKPNRKGYDDLTLFKSAPIEAFFSESIKPPEFLISYNRLTFDDISESAEKKKKTEVSKSSEPETTRNKELYETIVNDPLTKPEIREYCKDLKVLGARELTILIKWRAKLLKKMALKATEMQPAEPESVEEEKKLFENEEESHQIILANLAEEEKKQLKKEKRKKRAYLKQQQALKEKSFSTFGNVVEDTDLFQREMAEKAFAIEDEVLSEIYNEDESTDTEIKSIELEEYDEEKRFSRLQEDLEFANQLKKEKMRIRLEASEKNRQAKEKKLSKFAKLKQLEGKNIVFYHNFQRSQLAVTNPLLRISRVTSESEPISDQADDFDSEDNETDCEVEDKIDDDASDEFSESGSLDEEENVVEKQTLDASEDDVSEEIVDGDSVDEESAEKESAEEESAEGESAEGESAEEESAEEESAEEDVESSDDEEVAEQVKDILNRRKEETLEKPISTKLNLLEQPLFKELGIDADKIVELDDSELPQIPLTDKQLKKQKRKAKLEKEKKKNKALSEFDEDNAPIIEVKAGKDSTEEKNEFKKPENAADLKKLHALGSLVRNKRFRKDLIEGAYNRYAFDDDENVPSWFLEEEAKFARPELPITKELMSEYRRKMRLLAKTPIHKAREAVARKKMKLKARLESIKKRAQPMMESQELSEKGKATQLNKMLRNARKSDGPLQKSYVVSKKGGRTKSAKNTSARGKTKFVDKRLKKDKRATKLRRKR